MSRAAEVEAALEPARRGDPAAFRTLYEALAGPVAAYVRARGVADVEDVTSEVFLAVFTGIHRFDGDAEDLRSWVFTIAHRRVVDEWRRRGRAPHVVPYEPDGDERATASAEQDTLTALGQRRVHALLATLSPDQRDVLLLRIVGDLTVEQVAAAVRKRPAAVKALQRRGLAALRRAIETEGVPL